MLIHLLSEYLKNEKLREKFAARRREVLDEYEITVEARTALRSRDFEALGRLLAGELKHSTEGGGVNAPMGWPTSVIKVTGSKSTPAQPVVGHVATLQVTGEKFPPLGQARLVFGRNDEPWVWGTVTAVSTDAQGHSTMSATVEFDSNAQVGEWVVGVCGQNMSEGGISPTPLMVVAKGG
jgi:hypothetical protein